MIQNAIDRLTARLDHMVPDPEMPGITNQNATIRLEELSRILADILPDPSLSPDERLERLARVVQDRVPERQYLLPALEKVSRLERRLNELVPDQNLTSVEKIQVLLGALDSHPSIKSADFAARQPTIVEKLERMGDKRAGFAPME